MGNFKGRTASIVIGIVVMLIFGWQVGLAFFGEGEKELRTKVRSSVEETFPETFARLMDEYGLHQIEPDSLASTGYSKDVILVHGLDDPGIIWKDLVPVLHREGFRVWIMSYPNDQPIHSSAQFFARQLQTLQRTVKVAEIAVVSHSMGGLVTRDMLTSPEIDYYRMVAENLVPRVTDFIMVGTPNHGSVFARLRFITEIRDQIVSAADGDYELLQSIVDGVGEAGIDLFPGSRFLEELNGRPLPDIPRMLVVAGVLTPVDKEKTEKALKHIAEIIPGGGEGYLEKITPFLDSLASDIGDGLVSVESARLPGVRLVEVPGTHLTIIRNLGTKSARIPPAVTVVVEALAGETS